jgi:uncharacterized protein YwgA
MMDRLEKASLIISFIEKLCNNGSWCGETHIQKTMYFLQHLTNVPMEFKFILYKHGPFSFDLRDELTGLRADGLLYLDVRPPYGPGLLPTQNAKRIRDHFIRTVRKYSKQMEFVTKYLGKKSVIELERMGTALFVTLKTEMQDQTALAKEINRLKPHVPIDAALTAVQEVDNMGKEFEHVFNINIK